MAIPASPKPLLITVDTCVLLDLADGNETVLDCFTVVRGLKNPTKVLVVPTVIHELAELAEAGETSKKRRAAQTALQSILKPWEFCPINCVPVGHGIVEQTAKKLRSAGLLPEEELNDSFVLAESALVDAFMLISNDHHLRDIEHAQLKPILTGCDLGVPLIVSPWRIQRFFKR